jgi:hypothetical protein
VRARRFEPKKNRLEHAVGFQEGLPIIEAENFEAVSLENFRSLSIRFDRFGLEMLAAVEFNNKSRFDAREVCEERADGVLAAELEAGELSAAQAVP